MDSLNLNLLSNVNYWKSVLDRVHARSDAMLQEQLDILLCDGEATTQQQQVSTRVVLGTHAAGSHPSPFPRLPRPQLDKLDTALLALHSTPGARDRALEVVAEFVRHAFTVTESAGDADGGARSVEGVRRATSSLTLLVDHSPVHWSSVLLKVCACERACVRTME